ncbi:MAG TPA: zinc ribbon domain-containing protein [Pyrinomonadaceae bacterium]|jgi:hypothetical protein
MSNVTCSSCGAEIADGTKFCRQCGQPSIDSADSAEAVTQVFETQGKDGVSTRRLNPQPTNPTDYALSESVSSTDPATKSLHPAKQKRRALIRGLVILFLVASIGVVLLLRSRGANSISKSLVYPNSETIVDMKSVEGSALQLRTRDPFNKVVDWYVTNLKPTKTMKLTESNVLLKAGNITTVIAAEDNETNIVIKQAAER